MRKVCLVNIDTALLKEYLGLPIEFINLDENEKISCQEAGNLFFVSSKENKISEMDFNVKIVMKDDKVIILEDRQYVISLNEGYYYLLDFKSDDEIFRYKFKLGDNVGMFIFKKELNEKKILHFLLSIFLIERIL